MLKSDDDQQTQSFTWPMGDCDSNETIQMQIPLLSIRREASTGGNIRIDWKDCNGVRLCKDANSPAASDQGVLHGYGQDNAHGGATSVGGAQPSAKRMKVNNGDGQLLLLS
jgi:hypothetical protein